MNYHSVNFTYEDFICDVCGTPRKVKLHYEGYQANGQTYLTEMKVKKLESFIMSDEDVELSFIEFLTLNEPRFLIEGKITVI